MKIGLIGFGNLGKSFVSGLLLSGFNPNSISVTAKSQQTMQQAKCLYPQIRVFSKKSDLIDNSDVLILCVEPQNVKAVCEELIYYKIKNKTIISFVSSISIGELYDCLDGKTNNLYIIRAMPNIAISNCCGIIGVANDEKSYKSIYYSKILNLLESLGHIVFVEENKLELITVTAACGLAFASTILNSYERSIQRLLNNQRLSNEITLQLFAGVISLVRDKNISFDQLNNIVATKGGSTEAGLNNFDTAAHDQIIQYAIDAAYKRTICHYNNK